MVPILSRTAGGIAAAAVPSAIVVGMR